MRKWIIAGAVVLLILVIVAGIALVSLNSLIDRNKDYILAQVKETVGRAVAVGDIRVTLWGSVGARLDQFSVAGRSQKQIPGNFQLERYGIQATERLGNHQ